MLVLNLAMQFGAMCRGNMREDIEKDMNSIRSLAKSLYKISAIPVDTYVQNSGQTSDTLGATLKKAPRVDATTPTHEEDVELA